ncbi:zinc finger protein 469 [Elephas maximus indicus]|uniref:zinc finger protein 469 n=1 Tax=Elephas maximus indicus TaxID=99487 RepID=UPI00211600B6|nr:zinc finger protein 469 [Elephas maximus indicus]XP_049720242.1 zinc finger protein 469 [Elephas maximus indicus]
MPGEQPLGALPLAMPGDLQPRPACHNSGCPSRPPSEDGTEACRTAKGTREVRSRAQATELPKAQPQHAGEMEPKALSSSLWQPRKGGSPQGPPGKSHVQTRARRPGRGNVGPQQLYRLSIAGAKDKRAPDKTPEGPSHEATQGPVTGAPLTSSLPRAKAPPAPDQLSFQRCFPETPSSFTSTDYTSPSPTPGPPTLSAPQSRGPSPSRPSPYLEFPASGANSWPPAAENSFPGANFGVPPTEPEPFPKGSGPSPNPGVVSFQYPFPALHGAGPKPCPLDTARQEYADNGAIVFAFHATQGAWPEEPVGTNPAYPLPAQPPPSVLPCYQGPAGSLKTPHDLSGALSSPGVAAPAPSPLLASLHKSLTPALPERPPSAHDEAASPRGPPNPLPPMHFLGKAYGSPAASVAGTSPGPLDKELATPGRTTTPRPQLWEGASKALPLMDAATAPHPTAPPPPAATARGAFFKGQGLCLPHSPPLPWPPVLPVTGPGPPAMELLNRLPYPSGAPEWPGSSQGALGGSGHTPGPAEKLAVPRNGPGTPSGSPPGLFPYSGLQDTASQPLFFGVTPPQASPRRTPGLPPPRGVGASPSESPLPSPATTVASSSSCSSLSPLSSSPANPSSEEGQLPGPLGPSAFFHHPTHPQEGGSAFPPPKPLPTIPIHYHPEPPKAFPFPSEALGADRAFECLEKAPLAGTDPGSSRAALGNFSREPPPYSAHHFPLSSASLDQLDVLLTCRQCDQNYSNLASFLQHRQFCGLLLPRAPEGPPRPPTSPVLATPKAPADTQHPSLLGHAKMASFLLDGDVLHGLAATPLPLPASDLDLEDVAKLDSLITEALSGLEDPSGTPEIDSSFIDVFADEDPLGPRVPSTGQPPKTRVGATSEARAQTLLPALAPTPEPRAPCPGAQGCPPCSRPETRSRGPAPLETDEASLAGQPKRGKRFKLLREGLDKAPGPDGGSRTVCLRPRKKSGRAEAPPPRVRDLRAQTPRGHTDTSGQAPSPSSLPVQTRSSRPLRPARRKEARRRAARGGRWNKELIHRIVQQKNELHRQREGRGHDGHVSLVATRPSPSLTDDSFREYEYASESEEDEGLGAPPDPPQRASRAKGRPRLNCQGRHRGEKRKDMRARVTPGPREEQDQQTPKEVVRQEAVADRDSPAPESPGGAAPGPLQSLGLGEPQGERVPKGASHTSVSTETPKENFPPLGFFHETKHAEIAQEALTGTAKLLREVTSLSPGNGMVGGSSPPATEQPQPGQEDTSQPQPAGSLTSTGPRGHSPPAGVDGWPLVSPDRGCPPKFQPGELLMPTAGITDAAHPTPTTLLLKSKGLGWDPPHCKGDPVGVLIAKKGPQACRSPPSDLLLEPKELAKPCFKDLCSKPLAPNGPVDSLRLCPDSMDTSRLVPKPPRNESYPAEMEPSNVQSPLTLEPTSLFSRLPVDRFEPPLYDSLLVNKDNHVLLTCADPPSRRSLLDPPYSACAPQKNWPLPEEVSPGLPSHMGHFTDPPGGRSCSQKCLGERPAAPPQPPPPGKGSECGATFGSSLSEEELEIKRLVTELESQLQTSTIEGQAPMLPDTEPTGSKSLGRCIHQPPTMPASPATTPQQDMFLADGFAGLGRSSPREDSRETAVASEEGALGNPQGCWPCPAPRPLVALALHPGVQEDVGSAAPVSPPGATHTVQMAKVQRTEPAQAERHGGVWLGMGLPNPLDAKSSTEHSPDGEPWFPRSNETTRIHPSGGIPLLCPPKQGGGLSPEPLKAGGPCQDTPELGTGSSPTTRPTPGVEGQGDGCLHLGAIPPSGARHYGAPQEQSVGKEWSEPGKVQLGPVLHPAHVPNAGPGSGPQTPADSPLCQLQLLVARAAESEDGAKCPQHSNPSGPGGDGVDDGSVARSQAQGSKGDVQGTAAPAVAGCPLGPVADGHLASLTQAKSQAPEPKGQGQACQLQPQEQGSPGDPGDLAMDKTEPGATPTRHAGGTGRLGGQLEEGRAAWSLQFEAGDPPSPIPPDREALVLALTGAHGKKGCEDRTAEKVTNPGHRKQLFAGGSPVHSVRDLAHCTPSPASAAPLGPCDPEHVSQDNRPSVPAGSTGTQGKPGELLSASPSCGDPPCLQHLLAPFPTWAPLQRASCTPSPTSAGAEQCPALPPPGRTSPCGPAGGLADSSLLEDALAGDQTGSDFTPASRRHCPDSSISRMLEDSGKERPRASSTHAPPSPSAGPVSPRGTGKAPGHPTIVEAAGGLRTPNARAVSPGSCCPFSDPPRSTAPPGPGEGQHVTAKPTDTCSVDSHSCLEDRAGASSEGWEDPVTPGAGCSGSPQSHRHAPRQAHGGESVCLQDPKQKPRGFQKKPWPLEHSQKMEGPGLGVPPLVTCEICRASFRSGPGLSRHKARKHRSGPSSQHQAGLPTHRASEPTASTPRAPRKKGRKALGKEKPRSRLTGPSLTEGLPSPSQVFTEDRLGTQMPSEARQGLSVLGAPDSPPHPEPRSPAPLGQGVGMMPWAPRPRKSDKLQGNVPHPKHAELRGVQKGKEPGGLPSDLEEKSNQKERKASKRKFRKKSRASDLGESRPQVAPDVIRDRPSSNPSSAIANYPARPSGCLSPEGEKGTDGGQPLCLAMPGLGVIGDSEGMGPRALCTKETQAQNPHGDPMTPRLAGQDGSSGFWGLREPRTLGTGTKPSQAAGSRASDDSRGAENRAGEGEMGLPKPPLEPPGAPKASSSEMSSPVGCSPQGFLDHPEAEDCIQELQGNVSRASSPGFGGSLGLFDDEALFSQLFPLGDRLTRKKNPRVYGQRGKKPKPPPPPLEPSIEVRGPTTPCSIRLPTDLSDSGSPCLSHEEPWAEEAPVIDGFLSSKVPGIEPWAPSPSLWPLEQPEKGPSPVTAPTEEGPTGPHLDNLSEGLPELHKVPAAWRGLEQQAPPDEASSSLREMSPEPPSLEREGSNVGPPGNTGLPQFPALDFNALRTKFEMQDLCLLGPCEGPGGLPGMSFLDLQAEASSQGSQDTRPEAAGRSPDRDHQVKAKRGTYKCKVCFRRFGGLGELDLHKLAHSPSPPPTCYMCVERRFSSRQLLREHLREKHVQCKAGLWACGMCLRQVPDVWMYNEHLREHAVRFARRGQVRTSLGDLPGCLEEGSVIPHFLNILGQASQPHRGQCATPKASGSPGEAPRRTKAKPKAPRANPSGQDGTLMPGSGLVNTNVLANDNPPNLASSSAANGPPSLSPNPRSLSEPLLRAMPVHADCKDPSRHCHHCGKQFPKPFKLQRHLAVHSPQRVFLCPQCPRVYAEHRQLLAHRGQEHGAQEEPEQLPTPLYTCELCATVMRIIKRSFVCSACNYTFAKKEQFDRHMDKHRRPGQQPFAFRGVRRPGAPGQKVPALEGLQPSKRRRVAVPGSTLGPGMDGPQSRGSSPAPGTVPPQAMYLLCPEPAPSTTQGQSQTQEMTLNPEGNPMRAGDPLPDCQELLPPPLSPFLAPLAGGKGGQEDEGPSGSPKPLRPYTVPPELPLSPPRAGSQDTEEKMASCLFSGKHRTPDSPSECAPDHSLEDPSLAQRDKQMPRSHIVPEEGLGGASHKGGAAKAGSTRASSEGRLAVSTPSKPPAVPVPPRKAVLSRAPTEQAQDAEDRPRSTIPKAKPDPSSQGSGDPRHSTTAGGGSQPQPASGQLQSETATTPAKPPCPGQSPPPAKPPPQAPAKGHSQGLRGAREQGPQGSPAPRESVGGDGRKKKGRFPGPTRSGSVGGLGRALLVPDKPPRSPRKQAVPSRMPPTKPRLSSQTDKPTLQPSECRRGAPSLGLGGFRSRREGLGMAAPEKRPPHGPPRRGRTVPACPRALRTAESQSHLLSQLFGQRLTSFKIPLKRNPAE